MSDASAVNGRRQGVCTSQSLSGPALQVQARAAYGGAHPWLSRPKPFRLSTSSFFVHAACITCLILQRFGASFAHGQQLFLAIMVFPLLMLMLLATGRARINPMTAAIYIALVICFLISTISAGVDPDPKMRFSILSIGEILLIYAMLVFEPSGRFDSIVTLKIFVFYARLIAVLAILQYALQFAGVRLFSFAQLFPALDPVLTEVGYHVAAPISYGSSIFRSNGIFLLEPSILSQVMAIGMIVDYFVFKKLYFLPVFAVAMIASYSGTGVLALGLTILLGSLLTPSRLLPAALFGAVVIVVAAGCAVAFPAEFATLAARATGADPSGKLRYAAQIEVLKTVLDNSRLAIGFGPGASDGYVMSGSMSAALKLLLDYGILGLVAFTSFLLRTIWRMENVMVSLVCLIVFQTGGGYLVFSPFIFLMAVICIWSQPAKPVSAPRRYHRPAEMRHAGVLR